MLLSSPTVNHTATSRKFHRVSSNRPPGPYPTWARLHVTRRPVCRFPSTTCRPGPSGYGRFLNQHASEWAADVPAPRARALDGITGTHQPGVGAEGGGAQRERDSARAVARRLPAEAGRLAGRRKLPARLLTWPPEGSSMDVARSASSNGRTPGSLLYVAGLPELNNVRSDFRSGEVSSSQVRSLLGDGYAMEGRRRRSDFPVTA